jgi:AraC-like DNA-binding protein
VAIEVLHALLARAAVAGFSPAALLDRLGAPSDVAADGVTRVPAELVRALWVELPVLCGDSELGLNLARAAPDASLGVVAYVLLHARTLEEGFRASVRYARLLQDVAICRVEPSPAGGLRFVQTPRPHGPAPPRHAVEFAFARAILMARRSTGVELAPSAVRFAFARPADTRPHETLFRAPLVFDHPRNELELDAATLGLEQRAADPWLRALVDRRAAELAAALGGAETLGAQIGAALCGALPAGRADLRTTAGRLDLSVRTLQRRLRAEGLVFRQLVDDARKTLARRYLQDPRHTLAQIALMLGFSEQAAFQRAFRRWTGVTPGEFRRGPIADGPIGAR